MASLKFYYDYISQPARAVGMLLETAQVEHEKQQIKLSEGWLLAIVQKYPFYSLHFYDVGQHRTNEEYTEVCPCKQVPAIDDHGFCLFER